MDCGHELVGARVRKLGSISNIKGGIFGFALGR